MSPLSPVPVVPPINHPFWVVEGEQLEQRAMPRHLEVEQDLGKSLRGRWVNSQDLRSGDVVQTREATGIVTDVRVSQVEGQAVHNLTVERYHTFAVGSLGVLAHNDSWCEQLLRQFPERFKEIPKALKDNLAKVNAERIVAGLKPWPSGVIHGHHLVMKGMESAKRAVNILRRYEIPLLHNQTDLTQLKRAIALGKQGKAARPSQHRRHAALLRERAAGRRRFWLGR